MAACRADADRRRRRSRPHAVCAYGNHTSAGSACRRHAQLRGWAPRSGEARRTQGAPYIRACRAHDVSGCLKTSLTQTQLPTVSRKAGYRRQPARSATSSDLPDPEVVNLLAGFQLCSKPFRRLSAPRPRLEWSVRITELWNNDRVRASSRRCRLTIGTNTTLKLFQAIFEHTFFGEKRSRELGCDLFVQGPQLIRGH
jgi:hypothetical protein